eukprot:g1443.t1
MNPRLHHRVLSLIHGAIQVYEKELADPLQAAAARFQLASYSGRYLLAEPKTNRFRTKLDLVIDDYDGALRVFAGYGRDASDSDAEHWATYASIVLDLAHLLEGAAGVVDKRESPKWHWRRLRRTLQVAFAFEYATENYSVLAASTRERYGDLGAEVLSELRSCLLALASCDVGPGKEQAKKSYRLALMSGASGGSTSEMVRIIRRIEALIA